MNTGDFYDELSNLFLNNDAFTSCVVNGSIENMYNYLLENVSEFDNPNILDCGCGNGAFVNYLNDKNYSATGVVNSKKVYKIGKTKFPNANLVFDDMIKYMDDNENTFDVIFAIQSFGYVNPKVFYEAAFKSLKQNGVVFVYDFSLQPHIKKDEYYSETWKYNFYKAFVHCYITERMGYTCEKIELLKNVTNDYFHIACLENSLDYLSDRELAYPTTYKFKKGIVNFLNNSINLRNDN
jgi:SAM-dependent methyltransferase